MKSVLGFISLCWLWWTPGLTSVVAPRAYHELVCVVNLKANTLQCPRFSSSFFSQVFASSESLTETE